MNSAKEITRTQLRGYGTSKYHAFVVTKRLTPVGKEGRANTYSLSDVIIAIKSYLKHPRIQAKTYQTLNNTLEVLFQQLRNVVHVPFLKDSNTELNQLSQQLFSVMQETDTYLAERRTEVASIKGKYQS